MGRLSAVPLSHRSYKVRHDRAETDPSLAAAMLRMSAPTKDERFLDPFCGTGTMAIERALLGPSELIVAGDVNPRRLEWAAMNVAAAGVDVTLAAWDAYVLPVAERSFSRIVASPPHSNPHDGRPWRAEQLAQLLAPPLAALEYGGISVWLLRHSALFERAIARVGLNKVLEVLECDWKGRSCYLYVLERVP
jgi:23S rRNA G2445 N2-methylase RlmL